jgi:hypothetical protein
VDEGTLRKIQAVAAIGSGVVALHGATTKNWRRTHTLFVTLGLGASVGLFLLPRLRATTDPRAAD